MARYQVAYGNVPEFVDSLKVLNPEIVKIGKINDRPASDFGRFNNVALTFRTGKHLVPKSGRIAADIPDKKQSFFVSKNYQCVPYNDVAETIIKSVEDGYGFTPKMAYAQLNPGRIQFLLDYDNQIKVDIAQLDLIPFEQAINNASNLDYTVPNNPAKGGERMTSSIYADVGFNGRTGIIVYPAWVRIICSNLMISLQRLVKTDTIKHLGDKILELIKMELDQSMDTITGQYRMVVEFALFMKWIEKFYGKKALQYVTDLDFRKEVQKNFKLYYALQIVTMLNRGIKDTKIKGFGLGPKSAMAIRQIAKMAE